jgi:hypothetical protein
MNIAEEIAKYMPGWRADSSTLVRVVDGASVTLYVEADGPVLDPDERIEIAAGWPTYSNGERYHSDRYLKITVSAKRSAESIAGEIERRLLPQYLPAYVRAVADIETREAEQAASKKCAEGLATIVGGTVYENQRGGFGITGGPECLAQISVRRSHIALQLTGLDEVTAARILTVLKQREEAIEKADDQEQTSEKATSEKATSEKATSAAGSGREEVVD